MQQRKRLRSWSKKDSLQEARTHNIRFCAVWGLTLKQSAAVHVPALYSADGILLSLSNNNEHFIINLAAVTGRQLVNSQTAQSLERCTIGLQKIVKNFFYSIFYSILLQ